MSTKLIILLIVGALALGILVWMLVRAWRYRRNHPEENLFLLLPFCMLLFAGGTANAQYDGTATNPYRIRTAEQLVSFAECIGSGNPFYYDQTNRICVNSCEIRN